VLSALNRVWGRAVQTDAKVSPANYGGPLVDIRGRVIGVLTPLPVMGEGDTAGAQFYDSGIGFAAPLEDWLPRLETLKAGKDLLPGVMGVSLKPGDVYSLPAEIAVCQLHSPAYKAGLRAGDRIVELNGAKIARQVQLRQALGRHYAGDTVKFIATRGDERVEGSLELVDHLEPYEFPMLGILPKRGTKGEGVAVRFVLPESPAARAGLLENDVIESFADKKLTDAEALRNLIAAQDPSQPVRLKVNRGNELRDVEAMLASLKVDPIDLLPPEQIDNFVDNVVGAETGLIDLKLPEEKQACFVYVPKSYKGAYPHGLVIWFSPPGQFEKAEVEKKWADLAEKHHLIVMAPRPGEAGKWSPAEVAVVRKFADNLISRYSVDRSRIVAHGRQVGGSMAWLTALTHRNLVTAVAPVDAPLPQRATVENDPVSRLYVYSAATKKSPVAAPIEAGIKRLKAGKVPLVTRTLDADRDLNAAELAELVRWIDALDRI
jgi:serine protease Do